MAERLARVEARQAIEDLIANLARAFDAGPSAEVLRPLFHADAIFHIDNYGTLEGRDAIVEGVMGNADTGFAWTLHFLVSPRIALSDTATAAKLGFMLWETATSASGRAYWIGGRYQAEARQEKDKWVFTHLALEAELISHYPEGWHEKPASLDAT
ncbi:nuclear transport factor 2 family protein [Parasphingopyxis algicola]|uniref:nuclear transport factor 2 family protein n=1 Tax=Parasphingopyxis algicola TaxID=2026624 RepID=UPI001FE526CC|nr:nuclear transport factor 2 family protein [Parasphingopyxis algicola]